jgi:hypothetical protein
MSQRRLYGGVAPRASGRPNGSVERQENQNGRADSGVLDRVGEQFADHVVGRYLNALR